MNFCFFVVRGHHVYPFRKKPVSSFVVRKRTKTPFEGMVVLEWEGKMGRGELGVLFVCFFHPIVVLACVSDFFLVVFAKMQQQMVGMKEAAAVVMRGGARYHTHREVCVHMEIET